jgi:hypothetical protein
MVMGISSWRGSPVYNVSMFQVESFGASLETQNWEAKQLCIYVPSSFSMIFLNANKHTRFAAELWAGDTASPSGQPLSNLLKSYPKLKCGLWKHPCVSLVWINKILCLFFNYVFMYPLPHRNKQASWCMYHHDHHTRTTRIKDIPHQN